jgi:NAD(P)-dependent dehydrogenase (short-subunit alcohol dehydrogenase family)
MAKLAGRVAIVTGAAQGIGRSIALLFAREGARLMLADVQDGGGERTRQEIEQAGGEARCGVCDVGSAADVERLVAAAEDAYGPVSVLINNAAAYRWGAVVEMPLEDWELARRTIYDAAFLGARFAIPSMRRAGGGAIVTIASVHGLLAARGGAAYEAAKAGVIQLTRQLAVEYGPENIRANCICPGFIVTEETREQFEEHGTPSREGRTEAAMYPLRRYGQPDEIARAALFLASDDSSFVTGHALVVDGGLTVQLQDDLAYRMLDYARGQY